MSEKAIWTDDGREIRAVSLNGELFDWLTGDRFERIEYAGEYCFIPWVRITTWKRGGRRQIEAPIHNVDAIEFAPASVDRSGEAGETPLGGSTVGESAARSEAKGDAR